MHGSGTGVLLIFFTLDELEIFVIIVATYKYI